MPGFMVNGIGGNKNFANPATRYYYSYTWEIENILDTYNDILINAKDMTLPVFNTSRETVMGGSLEYKFAKSVHWDDIKITWYDVAGLMNIMKEWRSSVWNPQSGIQPAGSYKRNTIVGYYMPDRKDMRSDKDDIKFKLINSWPCTIRHGDLTYVSSDVKIVEVTLAYDWAEEITSYRKSFYAIDSVSGGTVADQVAGSAIGMIPVVGGGGQSTSPIAGAAIGMIPTVNSGSRFPNNAGGMVPAR